MKKINAREMELEATLISMCDAVMAANNTLIGLIDEYDVPTGAIYGVSKMLAQMDYDNAKMMKQELIDGTF